MSPSLMSFQALYFILQLLSGIQYVVRITIVRNLCELITFYNQHSWIKVIFPFFRSIPCYRCQDACPNCQCYLGTVTTRRCSAKEYDPLNFGGDIVSRNRLCFVCFWQFGHWSACQRWFAVGYCVCRNDPSSDIRFSC